MIARVVDERHVSRGYDPYNSAERLENRAALTSRRLDRATDVMIRRGMNYLLKNDGDRITRMIAQGAGAKNPPI